MSIISKLSKTDKSATNTAKHTLYKMFPQEIDSNFFFQN